MKRPDEFSGESPLAGIVSAWRSYAKYETYFPKTKEGFHVLALALHGAIIADWWVRETAQPLIRAQAEMEKPGNPQTNARAAIKILESCVDRTLAQRCIDWLRNNHNV